MKWYISSFYYVRKMHTSMIPLSTAKWDPKWFHAGRGKNHCFKDKRGVVNGLRIEQFSMPDDCSNEQEYVKYIEGLNLGSIIEIYEDYLRWFMKESMGYTEEDKDLSICLLVYEAENNPNSERGPIKRLFKAWGIELEEFKGV